jgi:hypothetical protein
MIVYVLFVHKKSVSKRKVCISFIKNKKFKKNPKNPFLWFFWVGFFGWVFLLATLPEGRDQHPAAQRGRGLQRRDAAARGHCHAQYGPHHALPHTGRTGTWLFSPFPPIFTYVKSCVSDIHSFFTGYLFIYFYSP